MSIRVKREKICTTVSSGEQRCWYDIVPIREWKLSPEIINISFADDDPVPASKLVTVIFPEVEELQEYSEVTNFTYSVHAEGFINEDKPFFSIDGEYDDNLSLPADGKVQFRIAFDNFSELKTGNTTAKIVCSIHSGDTSTPRLLEKREINVSINKQGEDNVPLIFTDKSEYYIIYDKNTKKYSGDIHIRFSFNNLNQMWDKITYVDLIPQKTQQKAPIFGIKGKEYYKFGGYPNIEEFDEGLTVLEYKAVLKKNAYSSDSGTLVSSSARFRIYFKVINSFSGIQISKKEFYFSLKKNENKKAVGTLTVQKEPNMQLTITKSTILSVEKETVSDTELTIRFTSFEASRLKVGKNKGSIIISAPNGIRELISITIDVVEFTTYNIDEYMFCLDYNPLIISATSEQSSVAKVIMTMNFEGYGHEEYQISQAYEYVFFNGKIEAHPGEDINDFFMEVNSLNDFKINESGVVTPFFLFNTAIVDIQILECNTEGEVLKEHSFEGLKYLPGKKPLAFPYLTNSKARSSYSNSLISLSAVGLDFKIKGLGNISGYGVDYTNIDNDYAVYNISFRRSIIDNSLGNLTISKNSFLSIEPIPNPRDHIDVVFINQNLCPDWLSFSGEWEKHTELNQILSTHSQSGVDFKAKVEEKTKFKLNTGWLFEEEVILIEELMKSKYCFVKLKGEWIRCIPVTNKPLYENSERNVNSQIVEFQIVKENER